MRRAHGYSLIELVVVMLIISFGLLGLASMFGTTAKTLSTNETLQQATQYAQECAESVITTRRNLGFDWFATNTFSCGSNPSGFTRTLNPVGTLYTGTTSTPCPNTVDCRDVNITVTSTANSSVNSSITILLVNY
jgi:prepilin-type N-terminal cleavage/methylation domain-containing protein